MAPESEPHSGPYLAAEGETWVTMAHYEELLAERDRLFEQLRTAELDAEKWRGAAERMETAYAESVEQLEAAQRVVDAARTVSEIEATGTLPDFQPLADALAALNPAKDGG